MNNKEKHNSTPYQDDNLAWEKALATEAEMLQVQPNTEAWIQVQELLSGKSSGKSKSLLRRLPWQLAAAAASVLLLISVLWFNKSTKRLDYTTEGIAEGYMPYYATYLGVAQDIDGYLPVDEGYAFNGFKEPLPAVHSSEDSI